MREPGGGSTPVEAPPGAVTAGGRRGAWIAFAPLLAPLLLFGLAAALGLTRESLAGTPADDIAYGYFLDRYPLFAGPLAYGLARLGAAALGEPGRRRALRWLTAPLALAGLGAVSLLPSFGGLVLRPAFVAGGGAFQNGMPWLGAHALGAAVAASIFGAVLGAGIALVRARLRLGLRPALAGLLAWAALWLAFAALGIVQALGLDPADGWPARPLTAGAAFASAGLVALALLPHALAAFWSRAWRDAP